MYIILFEQVSVNMSTVEDFKVCREINIVDGRFYALGWG
jgi:hypothetical protein